MKHEKSFPKPPQKHFRSQFTILFLAVCFLFSTQVKAQLDTSFGTNGVVRTDVFNYDFPFGLFNLSDQKILVVNRGQISDSGQRKYFPAIQFGRHTRHDIRHKRR